MLSVVRSPDYLCAFAHGVVGGNGSLRRVGSVTSAPTRKAESVLLENHRRDRPPEREREQPCVCVLHCIFVGVLLCSVHSHTLLSASPKVLRSKSYVGVSKSDLFWTQTPKDEGESMAPTKEGRRRRSSSSSVSSSSVVLRTSIEHTITSLAFAPPFILLGIDLLFKPLSVSSFLPPFIHFDDIAKMLIFSPWSAYTVHQIDVHCRTSGSLASALITSLYLYGMGVNQSVNAIDSYATKIGANLPTDSGVGGAIYFWDEIMGHRLSVAAYYIMEFRWMWMSLNAVYGSVLGLSSPASSDPPASKTPAAATTLGFAALPSLSGFRLFRGMFGGWTSALVMLESQAVVPSIVLDVLILTVFATFFTMSSGGKRKTGKDDKRADATNHDALLGFILVQTVRQEHRTTYCAPFNSLLPPPPPLRQHQPELTSFSSFSLSLASSSSAMRLKGIAPLCVQSMVPSAR